MEETLTICPQCSHIIRGSIIKHKNGIFIEGTCSEHGPFQAKYYKDTEFYALLRKNCRNYEPLFKITPSVNNFAIKHPERCVSTIHIDFTQRCNLNCAACFAVANSSVSTNRDLPVSKIIQELDTLKIPKHHQPMIVIIGGEPTLREDLPELIRKLKDRDFVVRLSTNGLKLTNKNYVRELKKAGLDWVLLQFDGFNPKVSETVRGRDLIKEKMVVMRNLQAEGIKIHLIVMVTKDLNDNEIYRILQFGFNNPSVYAVNLYPLSNLGRDSLGITYTEDILKQLEVLSRGTLRAVDFLSAKRILSILYKFTKKPEFRSKMCTFPTFLMREKNRIYSINRFLNPLFLFQHFKLFLRSVKSFWHILNYDKNPTKEFLYFNTEAFYRKDCLNFTEAFNCHNVYMTEQGLIPLCIYNILVRKANVC